MAYFLLSLSNLLKRDETHLIGYDITKELGFDPFIVCKKISIFICNRIIGEGGEIVSGSKVFTIYQGKLFFIFLFFILKNVIKIK